MAAMSSTGTVAAWGSTHTLTLPGGISGFRGAEPPTKAERLRHAKIHSEHTGAVTKIARDADLSGQGPRVKVPPAGPKDARATEVRGPSGPVVEERIAVEILARDDVKR